MSCGNRRAFNYNQKPTEVISYEQSFSTVLNAFSNNCTSLTATSIATDVVTIINEVIDLPTANWMGQFLMATDGNGIVEMRAAFDDGQVRFDYFHLCTDTEEIVV
jgi:hypothetical protein